MKSFTPVLFAAAASMVLSTAPAYADLGDQLFKLLPNDGAQDDFFGISVAVGGTTAIVGAHLDDDNGSWSGSAYVFGTTTGQQIAKILPNDGSEVDLFGVSVAISGDAAIIGAQWDEDNGDFSGSAYLFDISDPANPTQLFKLLAADGAEEDFFGGSVAISGTTAIVGALRDDDNGDRSGSAYLFDTTTGRQLFKLLPNDGFEFDFFGRSVAISGDIAIVGANFDDDACPDDPLFCNSGSAYLFDTTTGTQLFKLLPNDGFASQNFGISVAISGTTAIVGANLDDDNGIDSGSAYLFDISDPVNPTQIAKLLPDDGAADDRFGISVAISGTTAIVGAFLDDDNGSSSGSAYLFDAAAGTCPWDLDGNAAVGASDLLALLVSWGPCKGCSADFDGNGNVGASDLLALLANWGPCPEEEGTGR
ncbi:MAG: FG-GAP repeat protein [Phycisphaerales bacterium]